MDRISISNPGFTYDPADPDGFRAGMYRFGKELGASDSGATVYELPPGQAVCPYHYEYGEEEWVLVLDGRPTLRTPAGSEEIAPMEVAFFPKGPAGAHLIRNDTDAPARILMWSTVVCPTATAYPDSDKIGVWTGDKAQYVLVVRSSSVEYYHGETG